jgi:hypothetical protein
MQRRYNYTGEREIEALSRHYMSSVLELAHIRHESLYNTTNIKAPYLRAERSFGKNNPSSISKGQCFEPRAMYICISLAYYDTGLNWHI